MEGRGGEEEREEGRPGQGGQGRREGGQGRAGPGRKGREGGWEGGRPLPARPRSGRLAARPCSSPSPVAYLRRAGALLGVIRSEGREEEREGGREEGSQPPAQPREQTALVGKEGLEAVGSATELRPVAGRGSLLGCGRRASGARRRAPFALAKQIAEG